MKKKKTFDELVKEAFARHEDFKPKIINTKKLKDRRRSKTKKRKTYKKNYREKHHEELLQKHREYNASDHGKKVNAAYNKKWREKNKLYDAERKKKWWQEKMSDPVKREEYNARRREKRKLKMENQK